MIEPKEHLVCPRYILADARRSVREIGREGGREMGRGRAGGQKGREGRPGVLHAIYIYGQTCAVYTICVHM